MTIRKLFFFHFILSMIKKSWFQYLLFDMLHGYPIHGDIELMVTPSFHVDNSV